MLNARAFRRAQAEWLALPLVDALYWAKERRVCQVVRVRLADGRVAAVANFHATGSRDKRIPDAEVLRAATFADAFAAPDEICVLAGDFNVTAERSTTLSELTGPDWGFSHPGVGIDHVLIRGAVTGEPLRWPIARRQVDGFVAERPRAGGGDRRVNVEDVRAEFPVLERLAYLNAGSIGPLAKRTAARDGRAAGRRARGWPRRASRSSSTWSRSAAGCARRWRR